MQRDNSNSSACVPHSVMSLKHAKTGIAIVHISRDGACYAVHSLQVVSACGFKAVCEASTTNLLIPVAEALRQATVVVPLFPGGVQEGRALHSNSSFSRRQDELARASLDALGRSLAALAVPEDHIVRKGACCIGYALKGLAPAHMQDRAQDAKWRTRTTSRMEAAAALLQDTSRVRVSPGVVEQYGALHALDRAAVCEALWLGLHELQGKHQGPCSKGPSPQASPPASQQQQQQQGPRGPHAPQSLKPGSLSAVQGGAAAAAAAAAARRAAGRRSAAAKPTGQAMQVSAANAAVAAFMRGAGFANLKQALRSVASVPPAAAGAAAGAAAAVPTAPTAASAPPPAPPRHHSAPCAMDLDANGGAACGSDDFDEEEQSAEELVAATLASLRHGQQQPLLAAAGREGAPGHKRARGGP